MSWDEVIYSDLQGAFVYDNLDPKPDACKPKKKHQQPVISRIITPTKQLEDGVQNLLMEKQMQYCVTT
ncbi:hypothetical protein Pyn_03464 [Prunus yedoensis var. nudiflora]|uniref:Uncharacterized protein n=1 Tax=Prunus yedoensis var. nudiflora TaxID=2094558 RepID=A0A314Y8R7_PRUYE|nr:hypothetical protein Pyn_03464 [Prunus yedoensis var. nudiflora]